MQHFIINQVNTTELLKILITALKKAPVIILDTEFTRRNTYYPILNLLQISIGKNEAYILDNLENSDYVLEVVEVIYNSSAVKVFHSARNDLELLYNLMHKLPSNVFDTQIAYMAFSSISNISYAKLISDLCGENLNKSLSLSNWNIRPLSSKQISYAASDVIYLYDAYLKLIKLLKKNKREVWFADRLNEVYDLSYYEFNLEKYLTKYINIHNLNQNSSVLAYLIDWREKTAKEHNVPRQFVLNDDCIKQIVKFQPNLQHENLKLSKFINKTLLLQLLENIPSEYLRFDNIKIDNKDVIPKHSLLDITYKLLEYITTKLAVNKDLITTKTELNLYLSKSLTNPNFNNGWRYKIFGKPLKKLLSGKLSLHIKNEQIYFK